MASLLHNFSFSNAVEGRLTFIAIAVIAIPLLYILNHAIHNLYFHPLHNIPGPKTWIAFPILRHAASVRGDLDARMRKLHGRYGPVVRFSPNQISFITAEAWKDIYGGHQHGHKQLPKAVILHAGETTNIIIANDADHSRFRKSLAHAFSEKALSQQEPLMKVYIDLLIEKLAEMAAKEEEVDMVHWYNLTTFDLIGDLAFGEPFGGLEHNHLDDWINMIFKSIRLGTYLRTAREYPWIMKLLMALMPRSVIKSRSGHQARTRDTVMKRTHNEELMGRGDFMDAMLRHRGEKDGLTDSELVSNAVVLIVAGSETTATLLSGVTYWLLRTPDALKKVTEEVRGTFGSEGEINFRTATAKLPYMLACLDEAFRMYPPVPSGLQRIVPPGPPVEISGVSVPAGTLVSVHQSSAYASPSNFIQPTSYIPERWLHPTPPQFEHDNRDVLQPFSVGPRNCIGRNLAYNEMRLILARVLWNFDIELCDKSREWQSVQRTFTLWEKGSLWCRLKPRRV